MTTFSLPVLSGDTGFWNYMQEIRKIPSLEAEEEYMLAKRFQEYNDTKAAQKLVASHLKLVAKVAMSYRNYGMPVVELVSEGNLGLMQAVKKFDPEKGFRLSTYAVWWIKSSIQEYILRSWSLVKIGTKAAQKKLFFNLNKIKRRIYAAESRDFNSSDYKTVAEELDVTEADVAEMDIRMSQDSSLNDPIGAEEASSSMIDVLASNIESHETTLADAQEKSQRRVLFENAMERLNERERDIISERHLKEKPATLDDLSKKYSISRERIRQIEARAIEKLQQQVHA